MFENQFIIVLLVRKIDKLMKSELSRKLVEK